MAPILKSLLPTFVGFKSAKERARIKKESVKELCKADTLRIFPSHLLYIVAHYGACLLARSWEPLAIDNMMEVGEAMRRNPEIPVQLIPVECMLCPPCTGYDPGGAGVCGVRPLSMLASEKMGGAQLQILKTIGIGYNEPIPAAKQTSQALNAARTTPSLLLSTKNSMGRSPCMYV